MFYRFNFHMDEAQLPKTKIVKLNLASSAKTSRKPSARCHHYQNPGMAPNLFPTTVEKSYYIKGSLK